MGRSARDLVDEAKKRAVLLLICVFGLAYLMSLTSSSVWINMPVAASLIFFLRYVALDLDVRRHAVTRQKVPTSVHVHEKKSMEFSKVRLEDSSWKLKIDSPAVEAAIDHFNRHIISEWVTDLWYSRITPDKDSPEELVQIMNNVLGEVSHRARDINLINFLIRDIINLFCNHLELFRTSLSKIAHKDFVKLPGDIQDMELRLVLAAENNLHPALFSADAEHKVLQHLMDGLISFTFKPEDLKCSFFRYIVRELLACVVMRPVLNLANPRLINEKIENFVLSLGKKMEKNVMPAAEGEASSAPSEPSEFSSEDFSSVGVELVQLTRENPKGSYNGGIKINTNRSGGFETESRRIDTNHSSGEWGHVLDEISARKTQALAPEHLENMWTKGRHYRKKEITNGLAQQAVQKMVTGVPSTSKNSANDLYAHDAIAKYDFMKKDATLSRHEDLHVGNNSAYPVMMQYHKKTGFTEREDADSESSYATEDDENANVTGLDSPGTRVWDSKNKTKDAHSYIRHPLESSENYLAKKNVKSRAFHPRASRTPSGRKRHWPIDYKEPVLEEDEGSPYFLGDGSDDSDPEVLGRANSGATTTSSMSSISASEVHIFSTMSSESLSFDYSFLQLRCEVLGANIVKSGAGTFAVYSIAVVDADKNSWSIKRRFRHFEDLHRRLKEFQEYNLHLPPKHFLSSGLEVSVIQERCKLLDRYLKNLLLLPMVSKSIEVWDFLSVDSQTYIFTDSISIIQTLSVALDPKPYEKVEKYQNRVETTNNLPRSVRERSAYGETEHSPLANSHYKSDSLVFLKKRNSDQNLTKNPDKDGILYQEIPTSDKKCTSPSLSHGPVTCGAGGANGLISQSLPEADTAQIPVEWVQPNLSVPIFDLVDVIFQLQDGGWIRRQAFWVAKQVLQLGMGDAFDDWLIEKIQLLRKGSVIASAINRVEQILWPDGIFITKHPSRKRPTPQPSPKDQGASKVNSSANQLSYEQQLEALARAKFVRELIIDKAPPALISVIGRKEYEKSAQDIYLFLQSSVCLKQLAFELLELLLLAAFPELEDVVRCCHEDKERFGSLQK